LAKPPSRGLGLAAKYADDVPSLNDVLRLPDPGKCLPNVRTFKNAHWAEAQQIAGALGNDVTPTEVLSVAGNESAYGNMTTGMAKYGNFFGLHGQGPAGTYYTKGFMTDPRTGKRVHIAIQKFPLDRGFAMSGDVFLQKQRPVMTPGLGRRPLDFFKVLNGNGYATGNPSYPYVMTQPTGRRGPYTLMRACTGEP
jgi:hypothetical protein